DMGNRLAKRLKAPCIASAESYTCRLQTGPWRAETSTTQLRAGRTRIASTDSASMADKAHATAKSASTSGHDGAKRPPGHRAVDARDAIAELTERAQEISLEAGSKVSTAMKDVISAAVGIAGFAVESARDLVQYMVRRGQMTPEE